MTKDKKDINTLPTDEVSAQERSVTIRVLTVGTKQVTLALYKQLVHKSLYFNYDGSVKDTVRLWGWVNVCGCKGNSLHRHVIYEEDGMLKKALVEPLSIQTELGRGGWERVLKTIEASGQLFIAVSGVWK